MAKIDTASIEGYEGMTAEQKLAALEAFELPNPDYTGFVKKELLDKATSEAAGYKKQLREKMSQDEQAAAQAAETLKAMQEELDTLRWEKAVGEYTSQFISLGYDPTLAKATAEAMQKGDMATMIKNHAKFTADREKALKAELLKSTPVPPAGDPGEVMTIEKLRGMSPKERYDFSMSNPEEYKKLYGGN